MDATFGPWRALATEVVLLGGVAHAAEVSAALTAPVPVTIQAARSEWNLKAKSATFSGAVRVTRGEATLTADALSVQYASATEVDAIEAQGNVQVIQGGRTARAGLAVLTAEDGRIVLTGSPSLQEGQSTLLGSRLVIYLDDERATCEGEGDKPCALTLARGL